MLDISPISVLTQTVEFIILKEYKKSNRYMDLKLSDVQQK